MRVQYFSHPGSYHTKHGMTNEDRVRIVEKDNISVTVMCDGAGGLTAGGIAAELLSCKLADYVLDQFDVLYSSSSEKAKYTMICTIEDTLSEYANDNNISVEELATTIMIAAVDVSSGRCICFHLGDGIIFMEEQNIVNVVSPPRYGANKNKTFLTANCDLWKHLRFYRWNNPNLKTLILMTDGAMEHLVELVDLKGWTYLNHCPLDIISIKEFLLNKSPEDDFSCSILTI